MILVDDRDIGTDARILIKNGPLHRGALANTDRDSSTFTQQSAFITGFKEISTHHEGVLQDNIGFNTTSHSKHTMMDAA